MDSIPTPSQWSPGKPSKMDELRKDFDKCFAGLKKAFKASTAALPTQTGDGTYLPEATKTGLAAAKEGLKDVLRDSAIFGIDTIEKLIESAAAMANHQPMNDREYLMETLVKAVAKLPDDTVSNGLTDSFLTALWNDLSHPPQDLLAEKYQHRQPDGSLNNFERPMVGAAGMPYARTVAPKTLQAGALPDPGVLFDTLMARKEPVRHPNEISSMLFYFASIIVHDIFRTDHTDFRISQTSSYLDLAPLYGSNWKEQKKMRSFKDGKIHPDCFSETRLLSFPPGVGAIMIMFNRYHNYVVEQLASINENHRFDDKGIKIKRFDDDERDKRDEDLFQTGRLIVCGLYVNIILVDYVRTILNLNFTDSNWALDPRKDIPGGPPTGTGNQVSAEFNLVYRWHAAVSDRDDAWTEELTKQMFKGKSGGDVSSQDMIRTLGMMQHEMESKAPHDRPWPPLQRETLTRIESGPYAGSFKDDDLAKLLTEGVEDCANAMGPQQVPICLRAIEVLGIRQARTWQLSTLNEFRQHFGLRPHRTFDDITQNKEVADALKHLYDTPDNVELYPGLVVEDAKEAMLPGSGLCPSYTVSRGVLSDATALVRGDRFYTSGYTPAMLTNWGYQEASSDLSVDNGCVFYKLFLRTLPNNYDPASVYVHYPLTIPSRMKRVLEDLDKAHKYDFEKPEPIKQPVILFSYDTAKKVLEDQETFKVTWGKAMEFLMTKAAGNFMLAGDGAPNARSRELMEKAIYQGDSSRAIPQGNEKWLQAVKTFYEDTTTQLLKDKSYKLGKLNQVDIIREVGNRAHVYFAAELFSLPLKTEDFKEGIISEHDLYFALAAAFICVFFDLDPPKSFSLRQQAYEATHLLGKLVEAQVTAVHTTGKLAEELIQHMRPTTSALREYGVHMFAKLCEANPDVTDIVWGNIMGTCAGMVANQGQLFGQALDYLFSDAGAEHLPAIHDLAKTDSPEAFDTLMHYLMEFSRLNGETGVFRFATRDCTVTDRGQTHHLKPGDKIMLNLKAASRDPDAFPDPDRVVLTRPLDSYIHLGHGPHQCLGLPMTRVALTTMLKVIGRLDGLRPADVSVGHVPEKSRVKKVVKEFVPGDLKDFPESWHYHAFLTEDWDMYFPFPTSKSSLLSNGMTWGICHHADHTLQV